MWPQVNGRRRTLVVSRVDGGLESAKDSTPSSGGRALHKLLRRALVMWPELVAPALAEPADYNPEVVDKVRGRSAHCTWGDPPGTAPASTPLRGTFYRHEPPATFAAWLSSRKVSCHCRAPRAAGPPSSGRVGQVQVGRRRGRHPGGAHRRLPQARLLQPGLHAARGNRDPWRRARAQQARGAGQGEEGCLREGGQEGAGHLGPARVGGQYGMPPGKADHPPTPARRRLFDPGLLPQREGTLLGRRRHPGRLHEYPGRPGSALHGGSRAGQPQPKR